METKEMSNFETESYTYSEKKLWNPNNFIVLSVLFSFLPAAILYSLNYGRLGYPKKRNIFMISLIGIFVLLITLAINAKPQLACSFTGLNIGLGIYFWNSQKELYKNHIEQGGKKASYVIPMSITLIFFGLSIFSLIYSINIPQNMKSVNGDELYYTESVSSDDLDKLEKYLVDNQILLEDDNRISIKIDKAGDIYKLSFVINKEYINDKESIDFFRSLGQGLSQNVYENKKVIVQCCDNTFNVIKTLEQ